MIKSFAKINVFLKINGQKSINSHKYHTITSRFMKVYSLYDEIEIVSNDGFLLCGDFGCDMCDNSVYKAYKTLLRHLDSTQQKLVTNLKISINKNIPKGGGLGGGSSNAAEFLLYVNREFDLGLSQEQLCDIGRSAGLDTLFFLSGLDVADVSGVGDVISKSNESLFSVDIVDSGVFCDTSKIYKEYAKNFYREKDFVFFSNEEVFLNDAYMNNDLLAPLLRLYPSLQEYVDRGYFLSGSGGCFWRKVV